MTDLFVSLLNMSLTASFVILAVLIIRLFLKRVPKLFSYIIWLPVLIRLVLPFSFNSRFSFMGLLNLTKVGYNRPAAFISNSIGSFTNPGIAHTNKVTDTLRQNVVNPIINPNTAVPDTSVLQSAPGNPGEMLLKVAAVIWVTGVIALVVYSFISYFKILNTIKTATLINDNIYETDRISTPFVCGFFRPRIYIPTGLKEPQLTYILSHEQTHIKRLDYLIKPFSYMVLTLHWFNPLVWISFSLMIKDMEMSCDESVLRQLGNSIKVNYSNSLLSLSVKRSGLLLGSPLAFGESAIKSRIKNILNYKRTSFWVVILVVITTIVFIVGFTANPGEAKSSESLENSGPDYKIEELLANKTKYIGDSSKVVALVDAMPFPSGLVRDTIELQTGTPPYELKINSSMQDYSGMYDSDKGAIDGGTLIPNSVLLFCLIDNVDIINYKVADNTGKYDGASYGFTFTRDMAEKMMGEDVRSYSQSSEGIKQLVSKLADMTFTGEEKTLPSVDITSQIDKMKKKREAAEADIKSEIDRIDRIEAREKELIRKSVHLEIETGISFIATPGASSNPADYIKANQMVYESILKRGDDALEYLLSQFRENKVGNDLRGHIIMALCKDLLGDRNNVTDPSLLPAEWYSRLSPYEETSLGDFRAKVEEPMEQLVYATALEHYSNPANGFTVIAPTIFGSYEEENKLKVFATVFVSSYKLYNKTLSKEGGSIIPVAITFNKDSEGGWKLEKYEEAKDGSYFPPSIKNYCTMPVSGQPITGLYDRILEDYGDHSSRQQLLKNNLIRHLKVNNLKGISLRQTNGELLPLT